MEKVLWVTGVVLYLAGYATTFRLMYRWEVDAIYKDVSGCKTCKKDLENYEAGKDPELRMCSEHTFRTGDWLKVIVPLAFGIFSLIWPVALFLVLSYLIMTMLRWLAKRTILNVKSEAKASWEYSVREARVVRWTAELARQQKELAPHTSSKLLESVKILESGMPIPSEWLHGVKNNDKVTFDYIEEKEN